jgi:oxygen-independent coproporphyrinogen-3 oxidase
MPKLISKIALQLESKLMSKRSLQREHIPLTLYIHFPWCERKCPYCDFNSHELRGDLQEDQYIALLLQDLQQDLQEFSENRPLEAIFLGGGTPSLFSGAAMHELLGKARELIPFSDTIEITLEANPGSSEAAKFAEFRSAGINRLSLGIQSFNDQSLKKIGRVHDASQARAAAESAFLAGFDNFNLDLMFGLPDQSIKQACQDLEIALSMNSTHLSCYQLTYEPNTLFYQQRPKRINDDGLWNMQCALQEILRGNDFEQYEVSAYARGQRYSKHNLNYWSYGDYLGIGAGAHSKITQADGTITRSWKRKHPKQYEQGAGSLMNPGAAFIGGRETVNPDLAMFEYMLNGLRLNNGVSLAAFENRTGVAISRLLNDVRAHQEQGLIEVKGDMIRTTEHGFRFIDSILESFLPNDNLVKSQT